MTEPDIYAMGMESPTAWHLMPELCKAFGVPYPPKNTEQRENNAPDPLESK